MNNTFLISFTITYIVLAILIFSIMVSNKKYSSKMSRNDFIIRYPKFLPFICLGCSLFCVFIIIFMSTIGYNETVNWWTLSIFIIITLLALIAMYATLRIKIIIKDNDIIYFPAFGKKRNLTFDDIASVKYLKQSVTCYNKDNKRIFNIDFALLGYELFLSRIKDKPLYTKNTKKEKS